LNTETELTAAEQRYLDSKGEDAVGILAEAGLSPEPPEDNEVVLPPEAEAALARVQSLQAEHQAERISHARTGERLALLQQVLVEPAAAPAPPEPRLTLEDDIFGYVRDLGQRVERREAEQAAVAADFDLRRTYSADLQRLAQTEPDVLEAYQHLMRGRDAELAIAIPDPDRRRQVIEDEERGLIRDCLARGTSPAETVYKFAQVRGYVTQRQRTERAAAAAEQQRRERAAEAERQRQHEESEREWRVGMALKIQHMTPDEYHHWLFVDGKRRGETDRFYGRYR
jgi:hypothetical protein